MPYTKPLSYSGKSLYDQCPKRFEWVYVLGNREEPGAAAKRGTEMHSYLEEFFLGGAYPSHVKPLDRWQPYMESLTHYNPSPEAALAVTQDWKPTQFDSSEAYLRGKADLIFRSGDTVEIVDFKTGRQYDSHVNQGECYVAMADSAPSYRTTFIYLDQFPTVVQNTYDAGVRNGLIMQLKVEVDKIRTTEHFEAKPSDKCRWCPLNWRSGGGCLDAP